MNIWSQCSHGREPLRYRFLNWFNPSLTLPAPDSLSDEKLGEVLTETVQQLHSQNVVLKYTDHLSDRELYKVIYRDILPCCEKKVEIDGKNLEWRCIEDNETWLRYYASAVDRRRFQEEHGINCHQRSHPSIRDSFLVNRVRQSIA